MLFQKRCPRFVYGNIFDWHKKIYVQAQGPVLQICPTTTVVDLLLQICPTFIRRTAQVLRLGLGLGAKNGSVVFTQVRGLNLQPSQS